MKMNAKALSLLCVAALTVAGPSLSHATVLFSSTAESGTCNTGVAPSVWDYTGSGDTPNSRFFYRCDTPVPGTGRSKYFRVDHVNGQHDAWNQSPTKVINLSRSTTYYVGGFFRFDRLNSNDIWQDGAQADSYDKLFEMYGSIRLIITSGWHYGFYNNGYDHQYTFGSYISPGHCGINCDVDLVDANVSPYGRANPYRCDYGKWYAVVMSVKPSSGNGAQDGLIELYINGTKIFSKPGATQDSSTPYVERFQYSGTVAQPAYDAPAHYRKADNFVFTDSLTDIQNLGLMSNPEAGAIQAPPPPPGTLHVVPQM